MILSLVHQKGGTGKSTLCVALALWLVKRGRVPVVLDVDPQGTSSAWGRRYGQQFGIDVMPTHARLVKADVEAHAARYDDVIIDLPPTVTPQTEAAIEVSDMLAIPMRPTQADLWALDRLVALILVSNRKPPPPYRVLFNQAQPGDQHAVMDALGKRKITCFETQIPHSADWQRLFDGEGLTDGMDLLLGRLVQELPAGLAPLDH